ncbi:hypothetical protein CDIK_1590 [Cucumispora dikerogammari]|nr:hypothetical protein CDIK_1590 [Cucumispora dikerogammari]
MIIQSIVEFLIEFVVPSSIVVSNGFASYPTAVNKHGSIHQFCNHSAMEWVNEQGYHTNLIENLWMHFKKMYRSRNGVLSSRMEMFIYEFIFRKRYIQKRDSKTFQILFEKVLKIIKEN